MIGGVDCKFRAFDAAKRGEVQIGDGFGGTCRITTTGWTGATERCAGCAPSPPRWALLQKMKNNPMHSRDAAAGRHTMQSVKPLRRRANQRQTGKERGICGAASLSQPDTPSAGRDSRPARIRILRTPFDASGKTVALCHASPFRKSRPAGRHTRRANVPLSRKSNGGAIFVRCSSNISRTVPARSRLGFERRRKVTVLSSSCTGHPRNACLGKLPCLTSGVQPSTVTVIT